MTTEPTPNEPESQRPDLHVVRDTDPAEADTAEVEATATTEVEAPPETPAETTGPVPVLDADGEVVTPQAPLDVRVRTSIQAAVSAIPSLTERPASFKESLEYSQTGDWCASDNTGKRVAHGLATVIAYIVTYPLDLIQRARTKPIGFVLVLAVLYALAHILT